MSLAGLTAGKHVYSEKTGVLHIEETNQLVKTVDAMGVKFACAPVVMLGRVQQNVWKRIHEGGTGKVVSVTGSFGGPAEYWHPNADAFIKKGVGLFKDVAPYPLTAVTTMIGPVKRVHSLARVIVPKRILHARPRAGTHYQVTEKDYGFNLLAT